MGMANLASTKNLAQMRDLNELFRSLDKDNNGRVSADELRGGLKGRLSPEAAEQLVSTWVGADGNVPYTLFMGEMLLAKEAETGNLLWQFFLEADTDRSGSLSLQELEALLRKPEVGKALGNSVSAAELMREMDKDQSGQVDYEE